MRAIIPSILAETPEEFSQRVRNIEHLVERLHVDIADGQFVPHETYRDAAAMAKYPWGCEFGLHLMVQQPELTLNDWLSTGARELIIHLESTAKLEFIISEARKKGVATLAALKLETPVEKVLPYLADLDGVLLLAVDPGFYGAPLHEEIFERLKLLRQKWPSGTIGVDGGMREATLAKAKAAGADFFVVGSELANAALPAEKLQALEQAIQ